MKNNSSIINLVKEKHVDMHVRNLITKGASNSKIKFDYRWNYRGHRNIIVSKNVSIECPIMVNNNIRSMWRRLIKRKYWVIKLWKILRDLLIIKIDDQDKEKPHGIIAYVWKYFHEE